MFLIRPMNIEAIPILVDAIKAYYEARELEELCNSFDIELENNGLAHVETRLAKKLISQSEHGSNRRFLESIVPSLLSRCKEGIAKTEWQGRDFHEQMESRLQRLVILMDDQKIPAEITVSENQPFTAKSEAREFLGKAETNVTIVDPYIGLGTLDCLRDVRFPIRVLTGDRVIQLSLALIKDSKISVLKLAPSKFGVMRNSTIVTSCLMTGVGWSARRSKMPARRPSA